MFPRGAQADDAVKCGEAEVIFRDGLKKREAGDYLGALPILKQSLALCRSPGLGALYNIAIAEDKLGRTAASYLHYAEFLSDERITDDRRDDAKKLITRMRAEGTPLRFLNLDKLPPNASVTVDDALLGNSTAGYEVPAEPGDHLIVIREPGQSERRLSVTVVRGEPRDVDVLPPPPPPTPSKFTARNVGFVAGGVGVASLLTGAMTGAVALSMRRELTESCLADVPVSPCLNSTTIRTHIETGKTLGDASTATFIIGGALTALGATLILLPPTKTKEIALAPLVLPGGGGLSFSTRF